MGISTEKKDNTCDVLWLSISDKAIYRSWYRMNDSKFWNNARNSTTNLINKEIDLIDQPLIGCMLYCESEIEND